MGLVPSPPRNLCTIKVISGDDRGTALRVFVNGTVIWIVTTFDASARATGFNQLNVVVVVQANAALGVSLSARTPAGVILTPCIARVQPVNFLGANAPGDCELDIGISHRGGDDGKLTLGEPSSTGAISSFELDVLPEVGREVALLRIVFAGG